MECRIDYLAGDASFIGEVADLKYAQWRHTSPDRPYRQWVSEIEYSARIDSFPLTLVALGESGLLGFVTLIRIGERAGIRDQIWMITLYVKEAHRGKGIGSRLIDRSVEEARRLDAKTLYLWTDSRALKSFYEKRGWMPIGSGADGEDIMSYRISEPDSP